MATLEFDRNRKSMSVIACASQPSSSTASGVTTRSSAKSSTGGNNVLFVKGAAEYMLNRCSKVQAAASHKNWCRKLSHISQSYAFLSTLTMQMNLTPLHNQTLCLLQLISIAGTPAVLQMSESTPAVAWYLRY